MNLTDRSTMNTTLSLLAICVSRLPTLTSQIILTTLYAIIFPVSLLGNFLVLYAVYRRQSMRNALNLLIVNMAVADLTVTIIIMPYSVGYIFVKHQWFGGLFGEIMCKAVHFSLTTSIAASVFTMCVMTVDRFVAIAFVWRRSLTAGKSKIIVAIIWVLSFMCMAINLYVFRVGYAGGSYWCYPDWTPAFDNETGPKIFNIIVFVALYLLPLLLMAVLYAIICHKLWKKSYFENSTSGACPQVNSSKKRVVKMLITIVISFGVCWLPLHVSHYYIIFEQLNYLCWPPWLRLISFWLGHSNSAVNPCIYVYFNKTFRRAFMDALHLKRDRLTRRSTLNSQRTNQSLYVDPQYSAEKQASLKRISESSIQKSLRWLRGRESYRRLRALSLRSANGAANANERLHSQEEPNLAEVVLVEKLSVL